MDLFFILLVLLIATRAFGEIAERFGQPGLVGELIAGIVLGTTAAAYSDMFPQIADLEKNQVFRSITDLGMFFIMLFAGVELQPSRLIEHSKGAVAVAIFGMVIPMALGVGLGLVFLPESELLFPQAMFLGTALAITAVPATRRSTSLRSRTSLSCMRTLPSERFPWPALSNWFNSLSALTIPLQISTSSIESGVSLKETFSCKLRCIKGRTQKTSPSSFSRRPFRKYLDFSATCNSRSFSDSKFLIASF